MNNLWVISGAGTTPHTFQCTCICGIERDVYIQNIKRGLTKSCGCKGRPNSGQLKKEKRAWSLMRYRCQTPTSSDWANYGGRGIKICERWGILENFLADMGPIVGDANTLERIDCDKDYEPSNCRWATRTEQAQNKRNTIFISLDGRKIRFQDACASYGIRRSTVKERLNRGWDIRDAFTKAIDEGAAWRRGRTRKAQGAEFGQS